MSRPPIVSPVVTGLRADHLELPLFRLIQQRFAVPPPIDVAEALGREWPRLQDSTRLKSGDEIAVAVGSRGIDHLADIVRSLVERLHQAGCRPFIIPAMGSHGGATAKGQQALLASLGVTEEQVGAPVRASMDVVHVGEAGGIPLLVDRLAQSAQGIVLVNRIKPHTDFAGPLGSGLTKMLCIGLGKHAGAEVYHRAAMQADLGDIIASCGHRLLEILPIIFGVAVIENQHHQVCTLQLVPAREMELVEVVLQGEARALLPGLPLDDIDLLIVDEMGKDISGAGLDPNVIGRTVGAWSLQRERPRIGRIFVRGLTPGSHGNACGLGFVDVATPRLLDSIDLDATAINAVTSCAPEDARLPLTLPTERDAVSIALSTVRLHTLDDVRIVHIKNTSEVSRLLVSEGCLPSLSGRTDIDCRPERVSMGFDYNGNMLSPLNELGEGVGVNQGQAQVMCGTQWEGAGPT